MTRWDISIACAPFVAALAASAALSATGTVIDGTHFLGNDVLLRQPTRQVFEPYVTLDASPLVIWAPAHRNLCDSIRRGHLPLWNRAQGGGYSPVRKIYNNGLFFPLRYLTCAFPLDQAHSVYLLLTIACCLALAFGAFRWMGIGRVGAIAGALIFALSGPVVSFLWFDGVAVFMFAPLLVAAGLRCLDGEHHLWLVSLLVALTILAGHTLLALTSFVAVGVVFVAAAWLTRPPLRRIAALGAASVLGLALAWFALQPFLHELAGATSYKHHGGATYAVHSLSRWILWLTGTAFARSAAAVDDTPFFVLVGVLPLIGVVVGWRRIAEPWWRIAALVGWLLFVPGPWMFFMRYVPVLSYPKPWYYAPAFALPVAYLAGHGASALLGGRRKWLQGAAIGVLLLALLWPVREHYRPKPMPALRSAALDVLRAEPQARAVGMGGHALAPNTAAFFGLEDLAMCGPVLAARWDAWYRLAASASPLDGTLRFLGPTDSALPGLFNVRHFIRSTGPHGSLTTAPSPSSPARRYRRHTSLPNQPLLYSNPHVEIAGNEHTFMPRAYLARAIQIVPDLSAAEAWIADHRNDLRTTDVVESATADILQGLAASAGTATVRYGPADHHVEVTVQSEARALLILNDRFEDGWRATVDGADAPILAVNILSRGVIVPAGRHVVRMRYWPPGLTIGLVISGIAAMLWLTLLWRRR